MDKIPRKNLCGLQFWLIFTKHLQFWVIFFRLSSFLKASMPPSLGSMDRFLSSIIEANNIVLGMVICEIYWRFLNVISNNVAILSSKSVLFEASMTSLQVQAIYSTCWCVNSNSVFFVFTGTFEPTLVLLWSGRLIHACDCEILVCSTN